MAKNAKEETADEGLGVFLKMLEEIYESLKGLYNTYTKMKIDIIMDPIFECQLKYFACQTEMRQVKELAAEVNSRIIPVIFCTSN